MLIVLDGRFVAVAGLDAWWNRNAEELAGETRPPPVELDHSVESLNRFGTASEDARKAAELDRRNPNLEQESQQDHEPGDDEEHCHERVPPDGYGKRNRERRQTHAAPADHRCFQTLRLGSVLRPARESERGNQGIRR